MKPHTVPITKREMRKNTEHHTKQKRKYSGDRTLNLALSGSASYFLTTHSYMTRMRLICISACEYKLGVFWPKNENVERRQREYGRGRPRQSRERRASWSASSKHHTEWTSCWARAFYGWKPGLNLTSRLLRRHGERIYTYDPCKPVYSVSFRPITFELWRIEG